MTLVPVEKLTVSGSLNGPDTYSENKSLPFDFASQKFKPLVKGQRRIKSIELQNVPKQELEIRDMLGLLNIQVQGDGIYMYVYQDLQQTPSYHLGSLSKVTLWIVRNDEEYSADEIKGVYLKTVVVKDVAYHFFSSHSFM